MVWVDSTYIITAMLVILCTLAGLDLWRQLAIKYENSFYIQVISFVVLNWFLKNANVYSIRMRLNHLKNFGD